jgi:CBS-domain-containing membrane protein
MNTPNNPITFQNNQSCSVAGHRQLLASKGIRSVPVVEIGGRRLVGNVTSEQFGRLDRIPRTFSGELAA